jgi:hypothetical protein
MSVSDTATMTIEKSQVSNNWLGARKTNPIPARGNLLTKKWYNFCHDIDRSVIAYPNQPVPRGQNIIYPITGSIGLREAVKSFLRIAVQEGALDTFTDELTFMTTVDAKAGATITLTPISDRLRLVSGTANVEGNRADVHKVKISLAFPKARPAQVSKKQLVSDFLKELDAKTGYQLIPILTMIDRRMPNRGRRWT